MKTNQVARLVRVKLNSSWKPNSLGDEYLQKEPIIYIAESHIYNDSKGEYVFIKGGSNTNSGTAYLTELDLEFLITDTPLYDWKNPPLKGSYTEKEVKALFEELVNHLQEEYRVIEHPAFPIHKWINTKFNNPKETE